MIEKNIVDPKLYPNNEAFYWKYNLQISNNNMTSKIVATYENYFDKFVFIGDNTSELQQFNAIRFYRVYTVEVFYSIESYSFE